MLSNTRLFGRFAGIALAVFLIPCAAADEGMWPYNQFPRDAIQQKYKITINADFLDRLRLASVRVGAGSGSFVSTRGLILTSRQTVADCLPRGSARDAFYASAPAAETRCPGLAAEVLLRVEDVTAKVKAGAKDKTPAAQAITLREAAIARIEKPCAPGHRCSVVTLFSGGRYDLYEYQVYGDVRLVFAPEYDVAFFGKEHDSITYLRYGLDIAFLRAYENGSPASTPHFLKINPAGVKDGDVVIAAANPARTERSSTAAQLAFDRDTALPFAVSRLESRIKALTEFSSQSVANVRAAQAPLAEFLQRYKIDAGKLIGLRDDRLVMRKTTFEGKIRRAVQASKLGTEGGKVWDDLGAAYRSWAPFERAYQVLEGSPAPGSMLFAEARRALRKEAPAGGAALADPVEIVLLARYLDEIKSLGDKQAPVKTALGGRTPQQAAEEYVQSHQVGKLAKLLDEPARRLAKKHEEIIGSQEAAAAERIAQYRFQLFGAADYPDATGTPRVEFGVVKGYTDRAGVAMPYASTFSGMYYRESKTDPYLVPKLWVDLRAQLSQTVALDFVSTCDIGGGDSGGPTVSGAGELVGMIFDGNLESLPDVYLYSDEQARAVHVAAGGIAEALEKIYKATALVRELGLPGT